MKKRLLALLLALFCISANIVFVVADEQTAEVQAQAATEEAPKRTYLVDLDFNNLTMEELSKNKNLELVKNYSEVDILPYSDIDPESEVGKVLAFTYDGTSGVYECIPKFQYSLGESVKRGKLVSEVVGYFVPAKNISINFRNEGKTTFLGTLYSDRGVTVTTGKVQMATPTPFVLKGGQWAKIQTVVDFDTRTFSIYVDGEGIVVNEEMTDDMLSADYLHITAWPGESTPLTMYFQSIKCYLEEKKTTKESQVETIYTRPESILKGLGVLHDLDRYSLEAPVTRGRFAQLITRSMGVMDENIDSYNGGDYNDIGPDSIYKRPVGYLTGLGWVHSADGNFYPDNTITFEQAAKWMCYLIGHDTLAEMKGGWPQGYITVLAELGILKDMELTNTTVLTEGDAIVMLARLLETDLYKEVGYGKQIYMEKNKDHMAMEEYFNCHKVDGIVTATAKTGLATTQGAVRGAQLEIDSVLYQSNASLSDDLIGRRVTAYFIGDEGSEDKTIIYVAPDKKRNEELLLYDDKIVSVTETADEFEVTYVDEDGDNDELFISKEDAYFLYNGIAYGDVMPASYLEPEAGQVLLIDNDRDGDYEVVDITSYTYVVVKSVNSVLKRIYGQNGELIILDRNSLLWDGESELDVTSLAEGDMLEVCRNLRGDVTALVLGDRVRGTVENVSSLEITIDDETYAFSPAVSAADKNSLAAGEVANVYLDARGRICAINRNAQSRDDIGYVMGVKRMGGFGNAQIKIFTESGTAEVYTLSETFRYNGERLSQITTAPAIDVSSGTVMEGAENISGLSDYEKLVKLLTADSFKKQIATRTQDKILQYIASGYIDADTVRQLVTFRTRTTGNIISAINTEYLEVDKVQNFEYAYYYDRGGRIIANYAAIGESCVGFIIPPEGSSDEDYCVIDWETQQDMSGIYPEVYNMSSAMSPEALILYGAQEETITEGADPLIVERVFTTVNKDGDVVRGFDLYNRGVKETRYAATEEIGQDVRPGDIIRCRFNVDKEIQVLSIHLRVTDKPDFMQDLNNSKWMQFNYGVLTGVEDGALAIATKNEGTADEPIPASATPFTIRGNIRVYLYDLTKNKLYLGTTADIANYTFDANPEARVATRTNAGALEEVFIYFAS